MDVNMPGMGGIEAAGRIRIKHPDVRIALCTANIQEGTEREAGRLGLIFVRKPVTEASIAQMVTAFEG